MKYLITITDEHTVDGEKESSEAMLTGTLNVFADSYKIRYREVSEGLEDCFVTLKYDENRNNVEMTRTGSYNTQMLMEKHCRHTCVYMTPAGRIDLGVYTNDIYSDMNEDGGTLKFSYSLDINGELLSENRLTLTLKKTEVEK